MPAPLDATTAPTTAPAGNVATTNIPIDTTDHNKELSPAEVEAPGGFDFSEIVTTDKRVDESSKLPSNTGKPTTTKKPQKFNNAIPEETSEEAVEEGEETSELDSKAGEKAKGEKDKEPKEETEEEKKVNRTNKDLPKERDYSGFDEEDVKVLKKMRNEQYGEVSKLLGKYKSKASEVDSVKAKVAELEKTLTEGGLPPSYYDNPEAFTLTPAYRNLEARHGRLQDEQAHYQEQLLNVEEGKPFTMIRGYDKAGNPVYTPEQPASSAAKVHLNMMMQKYNAMDQQIRSEVAGLAATHKQIHSQAATSVQCELDKALGNLVPELRPSKEEMNVFKGAIPGAFKEHPMTNVASQMFGVILRQAKVLAKYKESETKKTQIRQDVEAAGATTRNLPRNGSGALSNGAKTIRLANGKIVPAAFDMADFGGGND
jgi:hypothetical protein